MNIIIVGGHFGSDAPGWYIGSDGKLHRWPGWNPEALAELTHAINVLREAVQIKDAGVREAAITAVNGLVQKELGTHLKEGGVMVIG